VGHLCPGRRNAGVCLRVPVTKSRSLRPIAEDKLRHKGQYSNLVWQSINRGVHLLAALMMLAPALATCTCPAAGRTSDIAVWPWMTIDSKPIGPTGPAPQLPSIIVTALESRVLVLLAPTTRIERTRCNHRQRQQRTNARSLSRAAKFFLRPSLPGLVVPL